MFANEYDNHSHKDDSYQRLEYSQYFERENNPDVQLGFEELDLSDSDIQELFFGSKNKHSDDPVFPSFTQQNGCMSNDDCYQYNSQILPNLEDYAYDTPAADNGINLLETSEIRCQFRFQSTNVFENTYPVDHSTTSEISIDIHQALSTERDDDMGKIMSCEENESKEIETVTPTVNDASIIADEGVDIATLPHNTNQLNLKNCYVYSENIPILSKIRRCTRTAKQPRCEDSVKKPESKKLALTPSSMVKNNNPEWHSRNEEMNCKICDFSGNSQFCLVDHYVNSHPTDEVFSSRVPPSVAKLLRDTKEVHQCERDLSSKGYCLGYTQFCYFCNTILSLQKPRWISHIASHTGNFPFQCMDCSKKFLSQNGDAEKCNVGRVAQRKFDARFKKTEVIAFLCDLCNFVRFDKAEIAKHLKSEHDGDGKNNYRNVVFLSFPTGNETHSGMSNDVVNGALRKYVKQPDDKLKTPADIKNNNPDWHWLNKEKICKICASKSFMSLVSHYVTAHPNREVFPSRVAPDVANFLRKSNNSHKYEIVRLPTNNCLGHQQICYFCNEIKCYRKKGWIEHIRTHTGYYKFQCTGCQKKLSKKTKHSCENGSSIEKIVQPYFDQVNLMAYLCDLCNYVRFDKEDIENHLRNEHDGNSNEQCKEVLFLRFLSHFGRNSKIPQIVITKGKKATAASKAIAPKEEIPPTIDEHCVLTLDEWNDMDLFSRGSDESDHVRNYTAQF